MIWWIFGKSGAGKTTLAKRISERAILLDADEIRPLICEDLGYTKKDRIKNNLRIARLAKFLNDKGFDVVVSTICPFKDLRKKVYWITKCRFIKVEGGFNSE